MSASSSRKFFVGGNWKCNGTVNSVNELLKGLSAGKFNSDACDVIVAPAALHVASAQHALANSAIQVSVQNCGDHKSGAFTGSLSVSMIADFGLKWVILGHSERRHVFGECNKLIGSKAKRVLDANLGLIACVGERLEERESGNTMKVVLEQLSAFAKNTQADQWKNVVIAYEPVWAIGTGKVAAPEDAQAVHKEIRAWLGSNVSKTVANQTRIIYGGSVKPANCVTLSQQPDIDGFLVGGASLKADDFLTIINASTKPQATL
mmetsp:Transcript_12512/g.18908  ORF Transcript_12512/g.18908 Transcript_12512/m.18908 type:complete len:263 (+) Transcript_12512:45-833(+)